MSALPEALAASGPARLNRHSARALAAFPVPGCTAATRVVVVRPLISPLTVLGVPTRPLHAISPVLNTIDPFIAEVTWRDGAPS